MVIASTLMAAILYAALTPAFPKTKYGKDEDGDDVIEPQASNVYIAWYIIALSETILTVGVSMFMRVISFKGTHMVQRMSLLTLIIFGEGIIVVCKSVSKIVKNDFLWTAPVVGQVIASILIIYFLYMSYFDRIHEDHFGTIKQQIWSFLHFPLHTVIVLVLQGVSILIIWRQAVQAMTDFESQIAVINNMTFADNVQLGYSAGQNFSDQLNYTINENVFFYVPKGIDVSTEQDKVNKALAEIAESYDSLMVDSKNATAAGIFSSAQDELYSATFTTLFDSLSVEIPEDKNESKEPASLEVLFNKYIDVFKLVVIYVFVTGGLALILNAFLGYLSLPAYKRTLSGYIRLAINFVAGIGLCMVTIIEVNEDSLATYMASAWIIPTVCITMFVCVLANHVRLPMRKQH
ncbi:hypothetical protein K504DRAFT_489740 [Pleomassaria siparia CBS 279.74]|uniref:Uncharacterized protein n=1 Tax=Pleomassaria siparia CBS 279.74 TaxID=1314801 RepID=A0A6G1KD09_9PLEO|nr:hypothetical protein K504DRAFT_489740 [Pleomassaria siparia CBS 279.74]